ncbi:MAG: hypothetical protein AB7P04_13270 [Bacteriovoracia bacterium]
MFIGHFALGFAAKKVAPRTSLGTLLLSVGFVDVLWPFFLLLGWEQVRIDPGNTAVTPLDFVSYPLSHSLLASVGWALLFGAVYFGFTRYWRGATVLAFGVLSHWFLDFFSHRPDLPIFPGAGQPKYGLGLWYSVPATLAVELVLFAVGVAIYARVTQARNRIGKWGLASFVATMLLIYFGNIFGPPPPSEQAIALFGPVSLALFAWPYWVDRHRTAIDSANRN